MTSFDALMPFIAVGAAVTLVVLAVVLIHRSRVNRERASAYAKAASEKQHG